MKRRNRVWFGVGASVVVIGAVAGATLGITTLLGVTFEEGEPKSAEGVQTGGVGVNRPVAAEAQPERYPGLSICVQAFGTDTAIELVAKANVEAALVEVMQHRYWRLLPLSGAPPLVDIGCPSEPLTARPGVRWIEAQMAGGTGTLYTVPEASFYRSFVYVMPLEQIDQLLGGVSIRVAPQEYVILSADSLGMETNAIYVTPDEVQDSSFLAKQITIAAGMDENSQATNSE